MKITLETHKRIAISNYGKLTTEIVKIIDAIQKVKQYYPKINTQLIIELVDEIQLYNFEIIKHHLEILTLQKSPEIN
jgi:hypothetical protein